jgi:hypothetical protein
VTAGLLLLAGTTPAAAATAVPTPPTGTYTCPDGVTVTLASAGPWTPLRVTGTGAKLQPSEFRYTLLDPDGAESTSAGVSKGQAGATAVTCTTTAPQLGEGGIGVIGTFRWTVTGTFRG